MPKYLTCRLYSWAIVRKGPQATSTRSKPARTMILQDSLHLIVTGAKIVVA